MPHVLVAGKLHDSGLALLRNAGIFTFDYVDAVAPDAYLPFVDKADALVIRTQPLTAETTARASRLKIVSRHGVGYDAVDVAALNARNIPLAIVGDVNSISVAEHAMMLLLATAKRLTRADRAVRSGNWHYRNDLEAEDISSKRLLILGFGRIGRRIATLADAFGMYVDAFDPFIPVDRWPQGPALKANDLHAALRQADFVTVNMPRSDRPVLAAAEFSQMKPGAILINTARGGIIDEAALVEALTDSRIAGAGLDVFDDEPFPADHPLAALDQVVLTPHIAGLSLQCAERMAISCVQNVLDFFSGTLDPALVVNRGAIAQ